MLFLSSSYTFAQTRECRTLDRKTSSVKSSLCGKFLQLPHEPIPNPIPSNSVSKYYDITTDIIIDDQVSFSDCMLNFAPNVKVTVTSKGQLAFTNCQLFACEKLWDGIIVEKQGWLTMKNCSIEDAEASIQPQTYSAILLDNNVFDRNRVAISINQNDVMPEVFSKNIFTASSKLNDGTIADAAITVTNAATFTILPGAESPNTIKNIRLGVFVDKSIAWINECRFINILEEDTYKGFSTGIGISAYDSQIFCYGLEKNNLTDPTFDNLKYGIYCSNSSLSVNRSHFKNYIRGVLCDNSFAPDMVIVRNNSFENDGAIQVNSDLKNIGCRIAYNDIVISKNFNSASAISLLNVNDGLLHYNSVQNSDGNLSNTLISLRNCEKSELLGNQITSTSTTGFGINPNMCRELNLSSNNIKGCFCGIHALNCPMSVYNNNIMNDAAQYSMHFINNCDNSDLSCNFLGARKTGLGVGGVIGIQEHKHNKWKPASGYTGLAAELPIGNPALSFFIVESDNNPWMPETRYPAGKLWFDNDGTPIQECLGNKPAHGENENISITLYDEMIASENFEKSASPLQIWQMRKGLYSKLTLYPTLLTSSLLMSQFYESYKYYSFASFIRLNALFENVEIGDNELIYQKLTGQIQEESIFLQNLNISETPNGLEVFKQHLKAMSVVLNELNSIREADKDNRTTRLKELLDLNNKIFTPTIYEENQKQINKLLIEKAIQGTDFTNEQLNIIRLISAQCTTEGGDEISLIRQYLPSCELINYEFQHTEIGCEKGDEVPVLSKQSKLKDNFDIVPNPASYELNVYTNSTSEENLTLEMFNLQGQKVQSYSISNSHTIIDTADLQNGVYIFTLNDKMGIKREIKKIIIQK